MKFDLISDLHVEFNTAWDEQPGYDGISNIYPWHKEKTNDILIMPGDMANDPFGSLAVVDEAAEHYNLVLFTDGNHDHYNGRTNANATVSNNINLFQQYADETPNVIFLNTLKPHIIGSTAVLGGMGWYDWMGNRMMTYEQQKSQWRTGMADSDMIRFPMGVMPDNLARRHADELRMAVSELQDDDMITEIVIATHTIPHHNGVVPDTHAWGPLNGSFINTAMEQVWIADKNQKIKVWCFGHTHFQYDFEAEGVRFINNARGYGKHRGETPQPIKAVDTADTGRLPFT